MPVTTGGVRKFSGSEVPYESRIPIGAKVVPTSGKPLTGLEVRDAARSLANKVLGKYKDQLREATESIVDQVSQWVELQGGICRQHLVYPKVQFEAQIERDRLRMTIQLDSQRTLTKEFDLPIVVEPEEIRTVTVPLTQVPDEMRIALELDRRVEVVLEGGMRDVITIRPTGAGASAPIEAPPEAPQMAPPEALPEALPEATPPTPPQPVEIPLRDLLAEGPKGEGTDEGVSTPAPRRRGRPPVRGAGE